MEANDGAVSTLNGSVACRYTASLLYLPWPYPWQTLLISHRTFPLEPECGLKFSPITHQFQSIQVAYKAKAQSQSEINKSSLY